MKEKIFTSTFSNESNRDIELNIAFGIRLNPGESLTEDVMPEISDNLGYVEYGMKTLKSVDKCADYSNGKIAHGPDPQKNNWLDIIHKIGKSENIEFVNVHARPSDEYALCEHCSRRMVITENFNFQCDFCGGYPWIGDDNDFTSLVNKLQGASNILRESNKKLLIENTYEPPHLMRRLMESLPDCGFTLDIGHALIAPASPLEFIYMLRDQIQHLHLHDNMGGNSEQFHDKHLPPGAGIASWNSIAMALRQIGFKGTATFECDVDILWFDNFRHTLGFS